MKKILFCLIVSIVVFGQSDKDLIKSKKFNVENVIKDITSIINGEKRETKLKVSPFLYLVSNNKKYFFSELKNNENLFQKCVGRKNGKLCTCEVRYPKHSETGVIVLQVEYANKKRWHTIFFSKNDKKQLEICHWHTST